MLFSLSENFITKNSLKLKNNLTAKPKIKVYFIQESFDLVHYIFIVQEIVAKLLKNSNRMILYQGANHRKTTLWLH